MSDNQNSLNPKKRGLGRGLDALFGEDTSLGDDIQTNDVIADDLKRRQIPVEWLRPCPFQPRQFFDPAAIEELASSIALHGVLQPLVVRPLADEQNAYEIIAGERRWRAAQKAQLHEVPVVIQYLDDEAVMEIALIENLQREDLTAIEEAQAYQKLIDNFGHSHERLAASLGKSRSHIANTIRLLALPKSVQTLVNEGKLSAGHARTLIGLDDAEQLARQIIDGNLSVRAAEKMAQDRKKPTSPSQRTEKDVDTRSLEEEISNRLGMTVTIDQRGRGGQVKISYKSLDQLDEVLHRLSQTPRRNAVGE